MSCPAVIGFAHAPAGLPQLEVSGLTLARRAALSAHAAGVSSVVLVVHPEDEAAVRDEMAADPRLADLVATTSATDLKAMVPDDAEEVIVARGDRVWSTHAMRALAQPLGDETSVTLGASSSGLHRLRRTELDDLAWPPEESMGTVREHRREWAEVRDAADVPSAEKVLLASLVKDTDGVISRNLNRKISMFFSRRLARRDVSPNHVTLVVLLIGIVAGPLAYQGTYEAMLAAGFCYWFSAVLDGTDGEISRLKYLGSSFGAWFDTITDDAVCLSFIVGVYLTLARTGEAHWRWIGIGGTAFFLLTVLPRYVLMAKTTGGDYQKMAADVRPENQGLLSRIALRLRDVVFRTDFLPFFAFMTTIAGQVKVFALPFAIGAVASSVDTAMSFAKLKNGDDR